VCMSFSSFDPYGEQELSNLEKAQNNLKKVIPQIIAMKSVKAKSSADAKVPEQDKKINTMIKAALAPMHHFFSGYDQEDLITLFKWVLRQKYDGYSPVANFLISQLKIKVNEIGKVAIKEHIEYGTALQSASSVSWIQFLIQHGAIITPNDITMQYDNELCYQLILLSDPKNFNDSEVLFSAVRDEKMLQIVLKHNVNVEVYGADSNISDHRVPLFFFAKKPEILSALCLANPALDLNQKSGSGFTALHYFCRDGSLDVLKVLKSLNPTMDANVQSTPKKLTPLYFLMHKVWCCFEYYWKHEPNEALNLFRCIEYLVNYFDADPRKESISNLDYAPLKTGKPVSLLKLSEYLVTNFSNAPVAKKIFHLLRTKAALLESQENLAECKDVVEDKAVSLSPVPSIVESVLQNNAKLSADDSNKIMPVLGSYLDLDPSIHSQSVAKKIAILDELKLPKEISRMIATDNIHPSQCGGLFRPAVKRGIFVKPFVDNENNAAAPNQRKH